MDSLAVKLEESVAVVVLSSRSSGYELEPESSPCMWGIQSTRSPILQALQASDRTWDIQSVCRACGVLAELTRNRAFNILLLETQLNLLLLCHEWESLLAQ